MKKKLTQKQKDEIRNLIREYVKTLRYMGYTYKQIRAWNDDLLDRILLKYLTYRAQVNAIREEDS